MDMDQQHTKFVTKTLDDKTNVMTGHETLPSLV